MGGRGSKSKASAGGGAEASGKSPMQEVTDENTSLRRDTRAAEDGWAKTESSASEAIKAAAYKDMKWAQANAQKAADSALASANAAKSARERAGKIQRLAEGLKSSKNAFDRDSSAAQATSAEKHASKAERRAKEAATRARAALRAAKLPIPAGLKP